MGVGQNIKRRRKELDMTLEDLAKKVGLSRQTLSRYETGVIGNIPSDRIERLANVLHTTPAYLMGWDEPIASAPSLPSNAIPTADLFEQCPVYGNVRGGTGGIVTGEITGYTMVMKNLLVGNKGEYFCLNVVGNSMEPRICEGDTVLVRSQQSVDSGDVAVVTIDREEGVVKKICYGAGWIELKSFNPYYPPRRFEGKEMERLYVTGKVLRIVDRKL